MNEEQLREVVKCNKQALLDTMKANGVTSALIEYSGSHDSGNGYDASLTPDNAAALRVIVSMQRVQSEWLNEKWHTSIVTKEVDLEEALIEFTHDIVQAHHDGYENDDGGGGNLTLDVADGMWMLEHDDYYTESVTSTHAG